MKNENMINKLFGFIFGGIGLILLTVGIILMIGYFNADNGRVKVRASIESLGDPVQIRYSFKGQEFIRPINYRSSSMYIGQNVEIYVDPSNPSSFKTPSSNLIAGLVLLAMGCVFATIGFIFIYIMVSGNKLKKRLLAEGMRLEAIIDGIDLNYSVTMNGRHPLVMFCSYDDGVGNIYKFKSKDIFEDPGFIIDENTRVNVYVDRANMRKYYVDVNSVPCERKNIVRMY